MIGTIGFLLMCNDRINDELSRLAMLDPLTGVFNRRTFEERAQHVIDAGSARACVRCRCSPSTSITSSIVNDEFGHDGGDEALRLVVALMRESLVRRPDPEPHRRRGIRGAAAGRRRGRSAATAERLRRHLERSAVDVDGRKLVPPDLGRRRDASGRARDNLSTPAARGRSRAVRGQARGPQSRRDELRARGMRGLSASRLR